MPSEYLEHHGIKGQKWYIRRFQNEDGTLTPLGRRRLGYGPEKEKKKKDKLLNSPKKLAKNTSKFTTSQLKTAVEKAELANKLKDAARSGKKSITETIGGQIGKLSDYRFKKKMQKEDLKQKRQLTEIAIKNAKAAQGKPSAEKWSNRAKKVGAIVDVAKSMKILTDDLGMTKESSGKTIFGAIATAMGLKKVSSDKDKKDDTEKKAEKAEKKAEKAAEKVKDTAKEVTKTVEEAKNTSLSDAKEVNSSNEKTFSFTDSKSAASTSSFSNIPFITVKTGGGFSPIPVFDDMSGTKWSTAEGASVRARKDGQIDRRIFNKGTNASSEFDKILKDLKMSEKISIEYLIHKDEAVSNEMPFSIDDLIHSDLMMNTLMTDEEFLCHHGIKGQKWGTRRYQNPDGSLTPLGKSRLGIKESKKALKSLIKENKRTYASEKKNVKNIYKQLKKSKNEKDKFKAKEMKADRKAMYKNIKKNSSKLAAWMAYSTGGVGGLLARNHGLMKAAQRQWVLKNSKKANAAQKAVEKAREKLYKQQLQYEQQKKKK